MTSAIEHVVVVIPARDEASTLAGCLASVLGAAHEIDVPVTVVLVLDSCIDASAAIAATFDRVDVLETGFSNVGRSRSLGVLAGLRLAGGRRDTVWIATTDADGVVPNVWLAEHLRAAGGGADAFVGAVVPVLKELDENRRRAWLRLHPPGATLGHVHGANLGVLASTYLDAGGFCALATGEDVELVSRLRANGAIVAESDAHPVITSSRLAGRVRDGYAKYLTELVDPVASL